MFYKYKRYVHVLHVSRAETLFSFHSFLLIYLLPDWPLGAYGPKFHSRHVESIYESISNANSTDGANSTLSVEKSSENHSGASKEFFIGNLSILTLCATIQHAITGELDRLNDKSKKNCVLRTNNLNDLNKKKKGADESGTERPRSVSPVSRNFRGILKATSENAAFVKDKLNSSRRSTGSYDYKKKDVNSVAPCLRYLMYDSVRKSYKVREAMLYTVFITCFYSFIILQISNMYKGLHHAAMMHPSTFTAALKKMEYMQGHQTGLISNLFKIVSENLKCDLTWMYPTPSKLLAGRYTTLNYFRM